MAAPQQGQALPHHRRRRRAGERELRILNAGGISNRFRFLVGELPEITEVEPNNEKTAPQKLASLPVVIDGQILDTDRDYFPFPAKAGETLVLSVQARSLLPFIADAVPGWFDPQLTVYDAAGKQVAFADDHRFLPDPVLFFRPPADGEYTLELRDVVYRGRGDFVYRLTMGALPLVTDVFPLGGQRGSDVAVEYRGVNLTDARGTVSVPADAPRTITVNGLPFGASDYPAVREAEANDAFERAQRITPPWWSMAASNGPASRTTSCSPLRRTTSWFSKFRRADSDRRWIRCSPCSTAPQPGRRERRLERSAGSDSRAQRRLAHSLHFPAAGDYYYACATSRARAATSTPSA